MMKILFLIIAILIFLACLGHKLHAQTAQPSAKMKAANELYQQKKWQESALAFGEVIKEEPNNGRAWYFLGMSLHSLGKYEQAIQAFEKNVAIAKNPSSMYNIASGYSRLKQPDSI
jgi:tetratricopeptide (TPR) repeat protein